MARRALRNVSRREFLALTAATLVSAGVGSTAWAGPSLTMPHKGGTFNYGEAGDFQDFNPWSYLAVNHNTYNVVFSRLLYRDKTGKYRPELAQGWEIARDGLTVTVRLRPNVKWHDGKELVAEDFITMLEYGKDEALNKHIGVSKFRNITAPIRELIARDKLTLEFRLSGPTPQFLDILNTWYAIRIMDRSDPQMLKRVPIGTGPYKMTQWLPNRFARFIRNPDFFEKGMPYLDQIMFQRLDRAETLVPNLRSGALQGIQVTNPSDVESIRTDPNFIVETTDTPGSLFNIIVNVRKPPFDKKEVRQALSYSLNRPDMIKIAFFGVSQAITTPFYMQGNEAYRQDLVMAYPFDLDRARSLLSRVGVNTLEMTAHVTPRWPQMKLYAQIWQADLAKIGVKLTVSEVETARFYEIGLDGNLKGFEVHPWLGGGVNDHPALFWARQPKYRADGKGLHGFYNEEMVKLIADGPGELDRSKRRRTYQRLNELLVDEAYVLHVATDPRVWVFNKNLKDYGVDGSGQMLVDRTWLSA